MSESIPPPPVLCSDCVYLVPGGWRSWQLGWCRIELPPCLGTRNGPEREVSVGYGCHLGKLKEPGSPKPENATPPRIEDNPLRQLET